MCNAHDTFTKSSINHMLGNSESVSHPHRLSRLLAQTGTKVCLNPLGKSEHVQGSNIIGFDVF